VACRHERSGGLCRERYVDGMGYGKNAMKFNRRTFPFFPKADSRLFVNWLIMPLICALRHACQPQLRLLRCCQGSNEIGKVVIRIEMVAYETCTTMSPQHCWLASTRVTNIRAQCAPILIKYEPLNSLRKFLFCLCLWKSSPITGRVCNLHTLHISLTLHGKKAKWTWIWQTGLFHLRPVLFFLAKLVIDQLVYDVALSLILEWPVVRISSSAFRSTMRRMKMIQFDGSLKIGKRCMEWDTEISENLI
jgi:hypothetical protein